jgi:hypothetical protein
MATASLSELTPEQQQTVVVLARQSALNLRFELDSVSPAETRNGQQCRRPKGLMRHTAMSCFPSMRVRWDKLRSAKGPPRRFKNFGATI